LLTPNHLLDLKCQTQALTYEIAKNAVCDVYNPLTMRLDQTLQP